MTEIGRVFQIGYDVNHYQALLVDGDDQFSWQWRASLRMEPGASIRDRWNPPPLYIDRPKLLRPDIFYFVNLGLCMVLSERALNAVGHLTAMSGELLPLPFEEESLQTLNVTEVINCLDRDKTIWNEVGVAEVPAFHALTASQRCRSSGSQRTTLLNCSAGKRSVRRLWSSRWQWNRGG